MAETTTIKPVTNRPVMMGRGGPGGQRSLEKPKNLRKTLGRLFKYFAPYKILLVLIFSLNLITIGVVLLTSVIRLVGFVEET